MPLPSAPMNNTKTVKTVVPGGGSTPPSAQGGDKRKDMKKKTTCSSGLVQVCWERGAEAGGGKLSGVSCGEREVVFDTIPRGGGCAAQGGLVGPKSWVRGGHMLRSHDHVPLVSFVR